MLPSGPGTSRDYLVSVLTYWMEWVATPALPLIQAYQHRTFGASIDWMAGKSQESLILAPARAAFRLIAKAEHSMKCYCSI